MLHKHKKPHHHHEHLAGEHVYGDAGQIVLALLFAATWITDAFFFHYTTFIGQHVPIAVRLPFGLVLLILSAYLVKTGLAIVFGRQAEAEGVIRRSVFNVVRHPVYLSEILLYLGLLLLSPSLAALVVWLAGIWFLHFISRYEESLLLERFGEEYEQYMREVPMWIPQFWKK